MSDHYLELLKHILDECNFILNSIKSESTKSDLIENEVLKRAIVRSLEIIGEATKKNSGRSQISMVQNVWYMDLSFPSDRLPPIHKSSGEE